MIIERITYGLERIVVPMLLMLAPASILSQPAAIKDHEAESGTSPGLLQAGIVHLAFDSLGLQTLEIYGPAAPYRHTAEGLSTTGFIIIIRPYMAANQGGRPLPQAIWYIPKPTYCNLPPYATPTKAGLYLKPQEGLKAYISKVFKFLRIGKLKQIAHLRNPYFPKWNLGFHVSLTFLITQ